MSLVSCDAHGQRQACFVCTHLIGTNRTRAKLGFCYGYPADEYGPEDDDEPCAWCEACEAYRVEHDGWTEEVGSPEGIAMLCRSCFDEIAALNGGGRQV